MSMTQTIVSTVAAPLAGLLGVALGAWLTSREQRTRRHLVFVERQLKEFYSPLLGIRKEIELRSTLRVRIQNAANDAWRDLCADARTRGVEALGEISNERGPEFKSIIQYDNVKFKAELHPMYQKMITIFRDNYWLAEPETQTHFGKLVEFVELWERWLADSIPAEVIERLGHGEEALRPFYEHLQAKHDALQRRLARGQ